MEAKTTIREMLGGNTEINEICVPNYQRAYSWEVGKDTKKQVNQFLIDIDEHIALNSNIPYYFGHFIFEQKSNNKYAIIDGQQRLTTIVIFLSAIFKKLKEIRNLNEYEEVVEEDTIKRKSIYRFTTVDYDSLFFKDYIIDKNINDTNNIETQSQERIADAFDYFCKKLADKSVDDCKEYIECIANSACTTHIVNSEIEAVSMFIFQNDRGKKPTKLEVAKAKFMHEIYMSKSESKEADIKELQDRFEKIYKSIAKIDNRIDEDDVLLYALRVYCNTLNIDVSTKEIEKRLKDSDKKIEFIKNFTLELQRSFENLVIFFNDKDNYEIYSLALLGKNQMLPFVIKAYKFNICNDEKKQLFKSLQSIVLRHRIIGTRAHLEDRLEEENIFANFKEDNQDINPIICRIKRLKLDNSEEAWSWWGYWSDKNLKLNLGQVDFDLAKYLLWLYENHLRSQGKAGYKFMSYEEIKKPQLEHIAPQTPTKGEPIAAGYCEYDDEFKEKYLDCLGNYLLLSASHNCSIGNVPFADKRETYKMLEQQREIVKMTENEIKWGKEEIDTRNKNIIEFLMQNI